MYNPQNYAISIERIIKAPTHSADQIEKNPLGYISDILDRLADESDEKRQKVFAFDDKYEKYKDTPFGKWDEADAAQMVKDLRELLA